MKKNETRWLCENSRSLERFSGQWVVFSVEEGVVQKGESLDHVLKSARRTKMKERSFVLHIPSKGELISPLLVAKKV